MVDPDKPKTKVNGAQVVGSALAAMTSAVLLSTLGVAGTIIGAAAGSLVLTVGGSFYTRYVEASRSRVRGAATAAKGKVQMARVRQVSLPQSAVAERAEAEGAEARAREDLEQLEDGDEAAGPSWQDTWRQLPWKRLAWGSVALFVAVMLAISAFELVANRSVSSFTGGSSSDGPRTTIPFGQKSSADDNGNDPAGDGGAEGDGGKGQQPGNEQPTPRPTQEEPTPSPSAPTPTAEPTVPPPPE